MQIRGYNEEVLPLWVIVEIMGIAEIPGQV